MMNIPVTFPVPEIIYSNRLNSILLSNQFITNPS